MSWTLLYHAGKQVPEPEEDRGHGAMMLFALHFMDEGAAFLQRGLAPDADAQGREMFHHCEVMDILGSH